MNISKIKLNKRGFTLIELLVVVSIIGLLSSIVLAGLQDARAKARDAQRLSDIRQIQNALELYRNDNGKYPSPLIGGVGFAMEGSTNVNMKASWETTLKDALVPKYIAKLPTDPKHTPTGSSIATDINVLYGYTYVSYTTQGCTDGQWYGLVYRLEKNATTVNLPMCNGTSLSYNGRKTVGMGK